MIYADTSSESIPVADRLEWWRERTRQSIVSTVIYCDQNRAFRARARALALGGVVVSKLSYSSSRFVRTPKLVRQSDPEQVQLALNLRGRLGISVTGGKEAVLRVGDFVLYDTSRPFEGFTADDGTAAVQVLLQVPRALIPLPANTIDHLVAVRLPRRDGVGALLSTYLIELLGNAHRYRPTDGARLSTATVDLLTALLANHLEVDATPDGTHQRILLVRIRDFIEQRLGDPQLSPAVVAAAHAISSRYLHKLFHDQGLTVAGWIRQRRLEHCRRDLADAYLRARPIHAIAARWGFTNGAHFSRLFRAAYGIPPSDYRTRARHSPAAPQPLPHP